MSGIPDDPTCSICSRLATEPPKRAIRVLTEVRVAWCTLYLRQLPAPGNTPSISFTACSRFDSVYRTDMGRPWPPPPPTGGDHDWLWTHAVNSPKLGVYEPYRKISELLEVSQPGGWA